MNPQLPQLVNDIQEVPESAYIQAIESYVDHVSRFPFVRAVYQCGSIGNPGISDLDLLVVVEHQHNPLGLNSLSIIQRKPKGLMAYLFVHDIYLYDTKSFIDLHFANYFKNLKLIYGDPLPIAKLTADEIRPLSTQIIFDFVSSRLAQFYKMLSARTIGRRGLILRISSIKHSYALLQNLGIKDAELEDFIARVEETRNSPYSISDEDLLTLFTESFYFFNRAVTLANSFFVRNYLIYFSDLDNSNTLKLNKSTILRFITNPEQLYLAPRHSDTVYYPKQVFFHYLAYTKNKNFLGAKAHELLSHEGDEIFEVHQEYMGVLSRRLSVISRHLEFLKDNKALFAMRGNPGFLAN